MPSSLFNVTVQKPQQLEIKLTDENHELLALAVARGLHWVVEVYVAPQATFTINTYLTEAKMSEVLQALVRGYQSP